MTIICNPPISSKILKFLGRSTSAHNRVSRTERDKRVEVECGVDKEEGEGEAEGEGDGGKRTGEGREEELATGGGRGEEGGGRQSERIERMFFKTSFRENNF